MHKQSNIVSEVVGTIVLGVLAYLWLVIMFSM
jgi:hypothetical protein